MFVNVILKLNFFLYRSKKKKKILNGSGFYYLVLL